MSLELIKYAVEVAYQCFKDGERLHYSTEAADRIEVQYQALESNLLEEIKQYPGDTGDLLEYCITYAYQLFQDGERLHYPEEKALELKAQYEALQYDLEGELKKAIAEAESGVDA